MPRTSSFSLDPVLEVSRLSQSCSRCRRNKVRCDGKQPACSACEKAGKENECAAPNDQYARGKERSYTAALEMRVEKMRRRLEYAESRKASVAMHEFDPSLETQGAGSARKESEVNIRTAVRRKAARERENSDVNSLVSDFGYLSINATTRDFEPAVSNMTFARLVLAASTNDPVPEPKAARLPSRQAAQAMVQYYLNNIHVLFPAFSPTTIYSILEDVYSPQPRQQRKSSDYWLLYLVLAIGSTGQSRSDQDEFYTTGVELVAQALAYADKALMPGYPTQIRSLLLLTQYSMLDPAHFDSWYLMGFTCRAVIDLGYHHDPPKSQVPDKAVLDARRRTFYCVYALDRAISMVHARAFSFTDDSMAVAFPSNSKAPKTPQGNGLAASAGTTASDAALLLFQLRRAQSHWYQKLFQSNPTEPLPDAYSFIWQMCHDMKEWAEGLPDSLPIGIREQFELELRYSYVYCIAPSARTPNMTAYGRMLIFEHAIAYIDRIYGVAHADMNTAFYTYHDALRVYFMGSQFVAVLRDDGDALIDGAKPSAPLSKPGQPAPLPLPQSFDSGSTVDNLDRSLRSLERVSLTLKKYGERWKNVLMLMQSFDMISAEVLADLRAKQWTRESNTRPQHAKQVPPQPQDMHQGRPHMPPSQSQANQSSQQTQPNQERQFQDIRWIDVDVSRI